MKHLYKCEQEPEVEYTKLYGENLKNIKSIIKHFDQSMKNREHSLYKDIEEKERSDPPILVCDRLPSVPLDCSNG